MKTAAGDQGYRQRLERRAIRERFATVVVFVNLLTDLLYASLDPRIRYE